MGREEIRATADRLLDAAEKLFGERGIDASSLREITGEAGANIAAVNYHFGSKEGLLEAAFARRMEPLNAERIALIDAAEAAGGDAGPDLRAVMYAFLKPTVYLWTAHPEYMRFIGRLHGDPDECRWETFFQGARFPELIGRIRKALRRALPDQSSGDLWWGMVFTVGAMIHTWAMGEKMAEFSQGEARFESKEAMVEKLVSFCTAGMEVRPEPEEKA